jgi:hypothetical protein
MVVYGGVWRCRVVMVVYGGVWWCMVVYGGGGGVWWCILTHKQMGRNLGQPRSFPFQTQVQIQQVQPRTFPLQS